MVIGTVQGVGYRYFAQQQASALGLTGFVRNLSNGHVEVVAEGERGDLEQFVDLLNRGPFGAYVREVVTVWLPATGEFQEFGIDH